MARARNIKPGLFKNELLGVADPLLTILFTSLWCLADKEGRLEDRPLRIKAETFPYRENLDINRYLTELERLGFIHRYTIQKTSYIQVVNFLKHQNPHKTEKSSTFPEYDEESCGCEITVKHTLNNGEITEAARLIPDSLQPDSLIPEKASPGKSPAFVLPDWIDSEKWALWLKTRKKKMIAEQMQANVAKLEKWKNAGLDHSKALADAADGGWQGLHEPDSRMKQSPPGKFDPVAYVNQNRKQENEPITINQ